MLDAFHLADTISKEGIQFIQAGDTFVQQILTTVKRL
jgi:hypothetical protein